MSPRRGRSSKSFSRRPASREPLATVLIVCEGEKSEPNYFRSLCRALRLTSVRVVGKECGNAPISIVDYAVKERKNRKRLSRSGSGVNYDAIWCVMDVEEEGKNPSLHSALDKAKAHELETVLSNPCFEFWVLLHFQEKVRPFRNCDEVGHHLKKVLPDYKKGQDCSKLLAATRAEAMARAKRIRENSPDPRIERNPSTEIDLLVAALLDMADKAQR